MQQVISVGQMETGAVLDGALIPAFTHREAVEMSAEELRRFLTLIESLAEEDWQQPTACSLWTVKDIVAHQAAHVSSFTSVGSYLNQSKPGLLRPYRKNGMNFLDAMNQAQVDLRKRYTPAELIAEIRDQAPRSLAGRDHLPAILRALTLPLPGLDQPRSLGYLFDLIYTRDMWMHRIDICSATGRKMPLDAGYDGRTVALIVRDLAEKSQRGLNGRAAVLKLTGAAGGSYRIGANTIPAASIEIDALEFCVLTSGRSKAAKVLADGRAAIQGDVAFGREVLDFTENRVLY